MVSDPRVSVVLLNFNGKRWAELWRSVFEVDYGNFEVIFVDNGSSDDSIMEFARIAGAYPHVDIEIVELEENVGYSKGNDIGFERATGKYVVMLSNDIEVDRQWMRTMVDFLNDNPDVAIAQSRLYNLYQKDKLDFQCNLVDGFGFCHRIGDDGHTPVQVFYSEGAVMFTRKEVVEKAGGLFDPDYFMFDEDIDVCWRVQLLGYKVFVVPKSIVYHARGGTVEGVIMKTDPFYVALIVRNKLLTFYKNLESHNLVRFIPMVMAGTLAKSAFLAVKGKRDAAGACINGMTQFIDMVGKTRPKRKMIQQMRKVHDSTLLRNFYGTGQAMRDILISSSGLSKEWSSTE